MKDKIKRIIFEWQERRPNALNRDYNLAYSEEIDTVIGLRRSGKTYFLFSEIGKLLKMGVHPDAIVYINFDDERLAELKGSELNIIIESYFELFPENINKKIYLFFDEIQNMENWHLFIKRLYEQKKFQIILTGSSSKLLSKEIATELRGRTLTLNFFPLSFKEFLDFKNFKVYKNIEFSQDRFLLVNYAAEFLEYGGYPRIALEELEQRKNDILRDYLDMIIYKDIVDRYNVRNTSLLKAIINYLLSNFASEFSINRFIKKYRQDYHSNKVTVFNYFSYLEEIGFLYYLPIFSYKIHQRYLSKKNYIADNGFIRLLSFRGMDIPGRLLENLVFTELNKRGDPVFYFRDENNHECDFLITRDEEVVEAIQVSHKITRENREREIRGLVSAMRQFGLKSGTIITSENEEEIVESSKKISVIPAWKWMLDIF